MIPHDCYPNRDGQRKPRKPTKEHLTQLGGRTQRGCRKSWCQWTETAGLVHFITAHVTPGPLFTMMRGLILLGSLAEMISQQSKAVFFDNETLCSLFHPYFCFYFIVFKMIHDIISLIHCWQEQILGNV